MITARDQLKHRLLHLDVASMSQRVLLFAIMHRLRDLGLEEVRPDRIDDLHIERLAMSMLISPVTELDDEFRNW